MIYAKEVGLQLGEALDLLWIWRLVEMPFPRIVQESYVGQGRLHNFTSLLLYHILLCQREPKEGGETTLMG